MFVQQLMARSKEKSEQLKSVTSVSTEEHARVVRELKEQHAEELRNIQERHVGELQKLRDTKNKVLKEQKCVLSASLVPLLGPSCFMVESSHISL